MAGTESILGQHEAQTTLKAQAGTDRVATDKDTFLKLLVAQLTHQDPLNPVEDKEFIAQLAQFTTVEELQNMNKGMETLNSAYLQQQSVNATSLIGQYVAAPGSTLTFRTPDTTIAEPRFSYLSYELPRNAASVTMKVYSMDSEGNPGKLLASRELGGRDAGEYPLSLSEWDGKGGNVNNDPDGKFLSTDLYIVNYTAKDIDGKDMLVKTTAAGKVVGVEMAADGNHILHMDDYRSVKYKEIELVTEVPSSSGGTDTSGSGNTTP